VLDILGNRSIAEFPGAARLFRCKLIVTLDKVLHTSARILIGPNGTGGGRDFDIAARCLYMDGAAHNGARTIDNDISAVVVHLEASRCVEQYLGVKGIRSLLRPTKLRFLDALDFHQRVDGIDIRLRIDNLVMPPAQQDQIVEGVPIRFRLTLVEPWAALALRPDVTDFSGNGSPIFDDR